jgi:hypothetical protein
MFVTRKKRSKPKVREAHKKVRCFFNPFYHGILTPIKDEE